MKHGPTSRGGRHAVVRLAVCFIFNTGLAVSNHFRNSKKMIFIYMLLFKLLVFLKLRVVRNYYRFVDVTPNIKAARSQLCCNEQ